MSPSTKRVLFILPSLGRGGAETQVVDLVNALDPVRFDKYMLTFETDPALLERVDRSHVKFTHSLRKHKFDLEVARQIAKVIDRDKIDLVHCSLQIALFMGWFGVRFSKRKPPLILAVHTTVNVSRRNDWFDKYVYQWLMRGCRKVIFVCHAQEVYWRKKFPFLRVKAQVIYNGVDTGYFDPEQFVESGKAFRHRLGIPADGLVICHIAGFRPEKGHGILIEAFGRVLSAYPEAFLCLAGDGVMRASIESIVRAKGLNGSVLFLGNVADVRPMLGGSDISIMASTSESFSIAMLEAMSMRVPLVATNVGGTAEAVRNMNTGLIVEAGDVGSLAEGMLFMIRHKRERVNMGYASRELVIEKFLKKKMIDETANLIGSVIAEYKGGETIRYANK